MYKCIGSGCYTWVPVDLEGKAQLDASLPAGSVLGGWERSSPTYVARARHEGHWEVGKLNAWARIGYSYFGKEYESTTGEILVARGGQVHSIRKSRQDHTGDNYTSHKVQTESNSSLMDLGCLCVSYVFRPSLRDCLLHAKFHAKFPKG